MKRVVAVSILLLSFFSVKAGKIDSLLKFTSNTYHDTIRSNAYYKLADHYFNFKPDSCKYYCLRGVQIASRIGNKARISFFYNAMALSNRAMGNYDLAEEQFTVALKLSRSLKNKQRESVILNNLGLLNIDKGYYRKALNFLLESLKICEKNKYDATTLLVYLNMGVIYERQREFEKALEHYKIAYTYSQKIKSQFNITLCLNNIGYVYIMINEPDSGMINLQKSFQLARKAKHPYLSGLSASNVAFALGEKEKFTEALNWIDSSLVYFTEAHDEDGICTAHGMMGNIYFELGENKKALAHMQIGYERALLLKSPQRISESARDLALALDINGMHKEAFKILKVHMSYKDSIYSVENSKAMTNLRTTFEIEKRDKSIQILKQKEKIKDIQTKRDSLFKKFAIGLTVLLLLLVLIILNRFRIKQKSNKELSQKNHIIEEKNKEITDSINYAQRIQHAVLPPDGLLQTIFNDSFILYLPKDIISGDFYWIEKSNEWIYVAAADCTGHGVPGALVSVVCSNALNNVLNQQKNIDPASLLTQVRSEILEKLSRSSDRIMDGMDISVCCINTKTLELKWAGANNPLWILSENTVKEVTADKQPVGDYPDMKNFTLQTATLKKGDLLYLFTDGYADQFGGKRNKKIKNTLFKELLLDMRAKPMHEQCLLLKTFYYEWKGVNEQIDDVCVIGIRV
ncbi:MAG: tetratricopeptide repeat protein [Flavobacteriales bacterium]